MSTLRALAIDALKETGAIKECDVHTDVWLDNLDVGANEEAKAILMAQVQNEFLVATEDEVDQAIAEALTHYPDECGYCTDNMLD
ncbi:hypothetical protein [Neorhizobium sp. NCHU2750]|uniref:hypothetical protein n=1 Tax=Neorhizobium sp. NCHU2750 TaxID=1825976 RepID=UPI000E72DAB7|nr:hypothetical protein NCHU2750_15170 [Neorhizobium sp. NCHU2750]